MQVLNHAVLADQVLNPALGLDVERVLVQQLDLVLALSLRVLGLALPHGKSFSPARGVVDGGAELGVAATQVVLGVWVHKELLSHTLWIRLRWHAGCSARGGGAGGGVSPDHDGQHLAIPYSSGLERECLVGDGLAIEVDALGGGGEARVGLDEGLEVPDGAVGRQLDGQQLVVDVGVGRGDGDGDARPGRLAVGEGAGVAQCGRGQLTWPVGAGGGALGYRRSWGSMQQEGVVRWAGGEELGRGRRSCVQDRQERAREEAIRVGDAACAAGRHWKADGAPLSGCTRAVNRQRPGRGSCSALS